MRTDAPGRPGRWAVAMVGLAAASLLLPATAQRREPGFGVVTVAPQDGWYTLEQAAAGEELYAEHCAACHGVRLEGVIGVSPPLAGEAFLSRWSYQSLNRLFSYTRAMMPPDAPRTLQDQSYVLILTHVLATNGFPAGSDPLRADRYQLGQLYIPSPVDVPGLGLPEDGHGGDPEAQ